MRIDVHQHLWTEPLIDALARRGTPPFVRRSDGLTMLHSAGEQPYVIDLAAEAPDRRAALVHADGLDLALIAISSPIGIEALPREPALELIDAHLSGVRGLGEEFGAWGPLTLTAPEPDDVDRLLARGCIGISVAAPALAGYAALDALGPTLERVAEHDVPLLVHPGRPAAGDSLGAPLWWTALTDYVAQMQAAWLTFAARGRHEHPELRVVFAMLAGGAPLLTERLAARGGPPIDLGDRLSFYDSSSYGPVAIEATARRTGAGQLVFGSDRPVIEPVATGCDRALQAQAAQLFPPAGRPR